MSKQIQHPLNNICVGFSPFLPDNEIWLMKKFTYYGKKVLIIPDSYRKKWEQMEEKEGVKAERYGSRIEVYPSTLQPIQLHKDCKKGQLLFFHSD